MVPDDHQAPGHGYVNVRLTKSKLDVGFQTKKYYSGVVPIRSIFVISRSSDVPVDICIACNKIQDLFESKESENEQTESYHVEVEGEIQDAFAKINNLATRPRLPDRLHPRSRFGR